MEHWVDIKYDSHWVAGKYKKSRRVSWKCRSLGSMAVEFGPGLNLVARHRGEISQFLAMHGTTGVRASELEMHIRFAYWERKRRQKGPWIAGSLPAAGFAKAVGNKVHHRYVLHFCQGTDHQFAANMRTVEPGKVIHFQGLHRRFYEFSRGFKGGGSGDAAKDLFSAVASSVPY